jgi:hypothetical protein
MTIESEIDDCGGTEKFGAKCCNAPKVYLNGPRVYSIRSEMGRVSKLLETKRLKASTLVVPLAAISN